jgi:hypothetical protein
VRLTFLTLTVFFLWLWFSKELWLASWLSDTMLAAAWCSKSMAGCLFSMFGGYKWKDPNYTRLSTCLQESSSCDSS